MKFKFFILMLMYSALISNTAFSQSKKTDSLWLIVKNAKEDTAKVNNLNALVIELRYTNPDTAFYFAHEAFALATKLNYEMGIADSKLNMGGLCANLGKYEEGVRYCNDALGWYNKLILSATNSIKEIILTKIGRTYNAIGYNRMSQGNYPDALKNSFFALKIQEEIGDKTGIAHAESDIGTIYLNQNNYAEALKRYAAALRISIQLGNKSDISSLYGNIGNVYHTQGNYPEALKNYSRALKLAEELKENYTIGKIYSNLGDINEIKQNYSEALKYYFASLKMFEEIGINEDIALMNISIGSVYTKQKKYNAASEYLGKGLSLSKEIGLVGHIKFSYEYWTALDSAQGNYRKALEHYKLFISYRDSLFNEEETKKIVELQMQYNFDKREDSLKQKQIITEAKLLGQKKQRYFYWVGLAMLALVSFFAYTSFRNQKKINKLAGEAHTKQKAELELQNLKAILSERLRISSELHDEVGATLSGIAMYSHLTKEQMKTGRTTEIEKSLNVMQQSSTEMVDKLNDIVWLINPEQDSLQKLLTKLEEYATDMAAIKNMQVKITVPEKIADINLPVESRRNIYLFCKEAINNAVKYSNASLLELAIKEIGGKLEFTVSDNGKGFDEVMVRRGNGLENMQKRADEIGAKLVLQSKENEGASVSLQCKIT